MSRRRDGLERRDALLDAALRCCSRSDVLSVGIEEIRREAAASPSSVYNLFSNLNDLMLALLARTFERLLSHLVERVLTTGSAKALVTTLVAAHLDWILEHPDEGRFMYQATSLEVTALEGKSLMRRKAELLEPVVAHMAPFIRRGSLPDWSILQFDLVLLGATHEACRRYLGGAPLDVEWMRRELPRLAWSSLAAERRTARREAPRHTG